MAERRDAVDFLYNLNARQIEVMEFGVQGWGPRGLASTATSARG